MTRLAAPFGAAARAIPGNKVEPKMTPAPAAMPLNMVLRSICIPYLIVERESIVTAFSKRETAIVR